MLLVSDSTYSNRHSLKISWSKAQDLQPSDPPTGIEYSSTTKSQTFNMISISTPDPKQSEAFIATTALFLLFSSSGKEDKVFLRLPAVWRDLWTEFADTKKEKTDEIDRNGIRTFRDMVREKRDRELEDGVLIQGAFKNRNGARLLDNGDDSSADKGNKSNLSPEAYQKIWLDKYNTPSFQTMLVSLPVPSPRCALANVFCSNPECNFLCGILKTKCWTASIDIRSLLFVERRAGKLPEFAHVLQC
jgi:ATP-dependent RNA helicase DHX29